MASPNYDDDHTRRKATARAAKMMKLFNKRDFAAIMKAVDPPPHTGGIRDPAFTVACRQAGLEDVEREWLRAYLEQCKKAVYDTIPDAASSGW